uniref:Uncharacterized protein n=1 Tax=Anguilla anguilla TaxID=7936 RepID=A0A0E9S593_ANGAN
MLVWPEMLKYRDQLWNIENHFSLLLSHQHCFFAYFYLLFS